MVWILMLQNAVKDVVEAEEKIHKESFDYVQHNRQRQREAISRRHPPYFVVNFMYWLIMIDVPE